MSDSKTVRYHQFAVWMHWILAALVIFILIWGFFVMGNVPKAVRGDAFMVHKTVGILILYFTLVRIGWRLLNPPPPMVATLKPHEAMAAKVTHFLFYVLTLGLPLSGWALVSGGRWPTKLFNMVEWPPLPFVAGMDMATKKETHEAFENMHVIGAYILAALLVVHIVAAIKHHHMDKDETLARITPGHLHKVAAPERSGKGAWSLLIGMAVIFGLWIFMGNPISNYQPAQTPPPQAQPSEAAQPAPAQPEATAQPADPQEQPADMDGDNHSDNDGDGN